MNDTPIYSDIILQLMEEKGLNQEQLAKILGVHQTTIGQWLHGKKQPGYHSIKMLYEKFGIEPNELFGL